MKVSATTIAKYLGGTIEGDSSVVVSAPARIESGKQGDICFFANPKYEHYVYTSKASIILVNKTFVPKQPVSATLIRVDDAYKAVADLLTWWQKMKKARVRGNSFRCRWCYDIHIACSARIGRGTKIYPMVYIGPHCKIGKNCIIYPGVKIYHDCIIGNNCIIHANAVIGADGFGFAPCPDGSYEKIPQTGNVVIEDDVEIGANTTVDRSTMGSTIIHKGVKLDNLCQIAHNVEVGENTVMAAMSGVAGSSKVGKQCIIGGQSGIIGHITVADHTTIASRTGVIGTVKQEGQTLLGFPAIDHKEYMRAYALFKQSGKSK